MILEDWLWRYEPAVDELPRLFRGTLDGGDLPDGLREVSLVEVRFLGVVGSVGLLFESYQSSDGGGESFRDVIVVVVQGVSWVSGTLGRGLVTKWATVDGEGRWVCTINMEGIEDPFKVVGSRAFLFGGRVFNQAEPSNSGDVVGLFRSGLVTWQSEVVPTSRPEQSGCDLAERYVQWE